VPTKILVADDSATMRRVLEMTFAGEDATVQAVDGAEAALAKAAEFAPDIVLADISMPGVDGYELARRLKANPQFAKTAVIVMANQQSPYDDGKGRAAGVDDHVSKPFDTQSLIDRVAQVVARARAVPGAEAAKPATAAAKAPVAAPGPTTGTTGRVQQGTRMGIGGAAPAQAPQAKPPVAPMPALRPAVAPPLGQPMAQGGSPAAKQAAPPPRPAAAAAAPAPVAQTAAAVQVATQDLGARLAPLGLTREQLEGVLALSREVIEQIVWEVVPDLAEQLIREEIKRLTAD
jgi:CheY-like chemotaxis protein